MKDLVEMLEHRLAVERVARLAAERQLAQSHQALARLAERQDVLVRERTARIENARDEAVAASSAKSAFVANVSHEIRTPLTSIIGFAELLLDGAASSVDRQEAVQTIIRNGRHLLGLVNDILDLSKVETGRAEPERIGVPVPALLRELGELVAGRAAERGLDFRIVPLLPLPATLLTDPVRLKQILLNLVGNAIKFTPAGAITLGLAWTASTGVLRFSVADTGIGMSPPQVERLFQPFVQADASTTREFGGTGLGLYLSRKLAGLLGATISVESEPGRGSVFHLDLAPPESGWAPALLHHEGDLVEIDRPPFAITQVGAPDLQGRVLVADDSADIRRLLLAYLQEAGLSVVTVRDGSEAVQAVARQSFDLILMDVQMPRLDGPSATRVLRAQGVRAPIVALTANVMPADVRRCRDAGCIEVLAKPIDREAFYDLLARTLGAASAPSCDPLPVELRSTLAALRVEFLQALPGELARLDLAVHASDWATARGVAHSLKGTAGSFGFHALTQVAGLAELAIRAQAYERALGLCERVGQEGRQALGSGS